MPGLFTDWAEILIFRQRVSAAVHRYQGKRRDALVKLLACNAAETTRAARF